MCVRRLVSSYTPTRSGTNSMSATESPWCESQLDSVASFSVGRSEANEFAQSFTLGVRVALYRQIVRLQDVLIAFL